MWDCQRVTVKVVVRSECVVCVLTRVERRVVTHAARGASERDVRVMAKDGDSDPTDALERLCGARDRAEMSIKAA